MEIEIEAPQNQSSNFSKLWNVVQWNLAKWGMKISDPIFPIEMDLAKRGINANN